MDGLDGVFTQWLIQSARAPNSPATPEIDSLIAQEAERMLESANVEAMARLKGRWRLHGTRA